MNLWAHKPFQVGCCCCGIVVVLVGYALMAIGRWTAKTTGTVHWIGQRIGQLVYDAGGLLVESIIGEGGA